jgi:murein DD-endopeptidase MepM/ murein hydrolase activator NlpD
MIGKKIRQATVCFLLLSIVSCSVSTDPRRNYVRALQKGKIKEDTSYVYGLPYKLGRSHLVVQGYFSHYSHKKRIAVDIKMPKRTKIYAARDGIVVRVVENNTRGGWSIKNLPYANQILIEHADGTRAGYWHLLHNGVLVNVGDTVKRGQVIGLCGRTGYSAFPHLHFFVWKINQQGNWQQIPTRFHTSKGDVYLRPFQQYRKKSE